MNVKISYESSSDSKRYSCDFNDLDKSVTSIEQPQEDGNPTRNKTTGTPCAICI